MKILFSIAFVLLSMMSFGQAGQYGKFLPGVIYDNFGHKYVGYVAFAGKSSTGRKPAHFQNAANNAILFKNDSLSEAKLIDTHIVRGFKIASDSFTILRDLRMHGLKKTTRVPVALSLVVVGDGKLILYNCNFRNKVVHTPGFDDVQSLSLNGYVVRKSGEEDLIAVEEGINEFMPQMSAYLKDNEQIVARIKNREYSYFKIEQLVRDYNALSKQIQ